MRGQMSMCDFAISKILAVKTWKPAKTSVPSCARPGKLSSMSTLNYGVILTPCVATELSPLTVVQFKMLAAGGITELTTTQGLAPQIVRSHDSCCKIPIAQVIEDRRSGVGIVSAIACSRQQPI